MPEKDWPYELEYGETTFLQTEVLVIGGGIAGCMAAIGAALKGAKVTLVEKGDPKRSGAGGSGCDHWEQAATNPCSKVKPEDLVKAMMDDNDGFNNGISHYIECMEGYDRLLDLEKMGAKVRDSEGEFAGADFRDEETGLLFAYDYEARTTLRFWGTTCKPAMVREMKRLGVRIDSRVMMTGLLTENGQPGTRCVGATGVHTRTGRYHVYESQAVILCTSRPARIWLFSPALPGLSEFRPTQCIGDGHAMGYHAGAAFVMMEKSVGAQFSAAGRSFPPYGAGNNHNTWYPASLIDSEGREIPYADRDGNLLHTFRERTRPVSGQAFFLKGGSIEDAKYDFRGPETVSFEKMMEQGYKPPFYADLTNIPDAERRIIWGMMVGEEGKTRIPILKNYEKRGFDVHKDVLQCYGSGWTSAQFMPDERQLFGLPGGYWNDGHLMSTLPGLFVAGDALYASNCYGHAAATGHYAGRHCADYVKKQPCHEGVCQEQLQQLREKTYRPIFNAQQKNPSKLMGWKELNQAISKTMQMHCGAVKQETAMVEGLRLLKGYEEQSFDRIGALNPHELTRALEVMNILTVSQMILEASLERKASCKSLDFYRSDSQDDYAESEHCLIALKHLDKKTVFEHLPLDDTSLLAENYRLYNMDGGVV